MKKYAQTWTRLLDFYSNFGEFEKEISQEEINQDRVTEYRQDIRNLLADFQVEALQYYSPAIVDKLLQPILAFMDERGKLLLEDKGLLWYSLHKEFYNRYDAGEYIFEIIEDVLQNQQYPTEVYVGLWLLLEQGFLGQYYDQGRSKLGFYRKQLRLIVIQESQLQNSDLKSLIEPIKKDNKLNKVSSFFDLFKPNLNIAILSVIVPLSIYFYSIFRG